MTERKQILCIDDDPNIHTIIAKVLGAFPAEVVSALQPQDGLRLAQELHPDLILLDLLMPDLNGWETLDAIRAQPESAHTPVVILTAKGSTYDRLLGANVARVSAYLVKPFRPDELRDCVRQLLWP